ncbi:hypothetical protein A2627_02555 [Candidatus Woesebacteria bacterium RIFCSPHIGHO2_01_FULL_39_28]|uniref:Membrane protein 6-pyruvoyl-tetrahydropterin synthase-related domain-containing protein n=1 Tax=Candidatus Woesebacteria bacterium RIFCSPHIGHO2_01_FULL_39_28 TaxID=1802496 RepID=A0A1F7YI77_9BACT|nr:MAG: hypothetical protein A2627_02555 [Candidatus Woesebacteria bacterium RIFCSPHIGHO2_01_FULL_39_28]
MQLNKLTKTIASALGVLIGAVIIGFVNFQIISTWMNGGNGPANVGSIEVSYVSMARFLGDFGFRSWAPFWYLGFPYHLFYTPFLPYLIFLLNKIISMPLWEGYRFLTGLSYILAPISLFFLGWTLSKRFIGGLLSGILYSVAPTIFYFFDKGVLGDRISAQFFDPRRFTILVRWGEGPHTLSLVFLPLAGVFFARYLRKSRFMDLTLASFFLGLTALSNALGMFAALLLTGSIFFARSAVVRTKDLFKVLLSLILVLVLALGLISLWYNFSFIKNFFGEGQGTASILIALFPWGWVAILLGAGIFHIVFKKVIRDFGIASSLLWFLILFCVVLTYYKTGVELLPQALRYNTEADMALSLLIGVLVGVIARKLGQKHIAFEIFITVITFITIILGIVYIQPFIPIASKAGEAVVDLGKGSEYKIAKWLDGHVDQKKGERVFIPGNYGFYLNFFTNVWQVRGGLFQAATHPWQNHIHFQLANGKDPELVLAWLTIVNVKYAVVTTPASMELYKETKNLERFETFPISLEQSGDVIYEVPLKRSSLAKPVNLKLLASPAGGLKSPKRADDKAPILAYADWVENSSLNETTFEVVNNDNYKIKGSVASGEGILVQMTADPGWQAKDQYGNKLQIQKDPLGFFVINTPRPGDISISLKRGRTWDEWLGYILTLITIIGMVLWKTKHHQFKPQN